MKQLTQQKNCSEKSHNRFVNLKEEEVAAAANSSPPFIAQINNL
jgi:hypothetical protein